MPLAQNTARSHATSTVREADEHHTSFSGSHHSAFGEPDEPSANQATNKGDDSANIPRMRLLDRAQLMDLMLFPQNNSEVVVVPSNKEGTGFLNHCYDEEHLRGFIS